MPAEQKEEENKMSKYYAEENGETAFELFNKRTVYRLHVSDPAYPNLVDFIAEKAMYGRVNRRFVPIALPAKTKNLKPLPQGVSPEASPSALNFVADAFNDLARQFRKCAMVGTIDTTDPYLTNLKVYKAHEKSRQRYKDYTKMYTQAFNSVVGSESTKIENFDMFTERLLGALKRGGLRSPYTFPAYVKSRQCPILVSGLAIEIADLDPANDDEKIKQFIESNNWKFFLNACRTYGFMVDKNIPWRIIADIGSSPMIQYATRYGYSSTDEVLRSVYSSAHEGFYTAMPQQLLTMYNKVKPKGIQSLEDCGGNTIVKMRKPKAYKTLAYLKTLYSETYFLELYCKMRFFEEESPITENEKRLLIDDVVETWRLKGFYYAARKFEIFLNKPFDYEGSLGYYINKQKEKETNST